MRTYQDFLEVGMNEQDRMKFVYEAISEHKAGKDYRQAMIANEYEKHQNRTINAYQKVLYEVTGRAVPDTYSANWKMASNFFHRFVTQEVQYLLGNGVTWQFPETKEILGDRFDTQLQKAAMKALVEGVSFGFWNLNKLEVFGLTEFVPLYDEDNGSLMAGIRFWQVAADRPLRATLYELDGYTDYRWDEGQGQIIRDKRAYIIETSTSQMDGTEILDQRNYPNFPVVPLWGNKNRQSELVGIREQIDCYDLIKSGFANDVDDAALIYWTLQNAGGMDDVDLATFVERMKTLHAASVEDSRVQIQSHSIDVPYASREALLDRIRADLYEDAMALDTKQLASGGSAVTAAIRAAYDPLNSKCDDFEYCIHEFLDNILELAGIEGERPTFTRSMLLNVSEEISSIMSVADRLSEDYVVRKVMTLLGDGDQVEDVLNELTAESIDRFTGGTEEEPAEE